MTRATFRRLACLCALFGLACGNTDAGVPQIPTLVEKAAAANSASLAGVVVQERHMSIAVSAGPVSYREQNDAVVMMQDGTFKQVRYLRIVENGKQLGPDQLAQKDAQNNHDLQRGEAFFKQPYDGRYMRDYALTDQGNGTIAFKSLVRDDQHGDGTMRIDPATGRVMQVTYTPDVLPKHASTGTTIETFGEPIPGVWTIVSIERTYEGHVAFFRGGGKVIETLDHFRKFGDPSAGMAFVDRLTE